MEGFSEEDIACIPDVKSSTSGIPDVVGRYYYQYLTANGEQYVYQHTNHICVLGLAVGHPILKEGKTVKSVNFDTGKVHYSEVAVTGKSKKGGHWMDPATQLCMITCEDGSQYPFFAAIRARLIEVNSRLEEDPSLLTTKAATEGFIALLKPKYNEHGSACEGLVKVQDPKMLLRENL